MLSVFPIQFLALFAYFILRVTVGLLLVFLGLRHLAYHQELRHILRVSWWPYGGFSALLFAASELALGIFIVVGAYTQVATLIVAFMCIKLLMIRHWFAHHTIPGRLFYFLLLGACLSLTITGAGVFAFDLPI